MRLVEQVVVVAFRRFGLRVFFHKLVANNELCCRLCTHLLLKLFLCSNLGQSFLLLIVVVPVAAPLKLRLRRITELVCEEVVDLIENSIHDARVVQLYELHKSHCQVDFDLVK